ncbi:head maturation protease [Escherichia phage Rtp]|uniref:Possible prohead protease n=1 Tax=Escherichia phage Rtp TaxID=2994041 RepID=Q333F9_9CAUD|nr:head maturation protease [Escherichia phage Rtp]CAJ42229.1 possible prohead protease [Escherichia phage Rtp]
MSKIRYDSAKFKATIDENGFLVDTPVVARLGVQVYYMEDGRTVREFRPAEEVFKDESLASYQGKPMTLDHVFVNSENAKDVVVGSVTGKAEPLGSSVVAPIVVYDNTAIQEAMAGNAKELSVGYTAVLDETPGWGDPVTGEYILKIDDRQELQPPEGWLEFDAIQRDIKVNHLAMVYRGRAGIAKLNMDGEQENPYTTDVDINKEDKQEMIKIKLDGAQEFEVAPEVASHIEALNAKADTAIAERDSLKAKVDAIPAEIEAAVAKAKADADALAALVAVAAEAGVKADGLDAKGIKVAYVKEVSGLDVSEKSDAYIDAAFDIAKESDKMAEVRKATTASDKSDSAEEPKKLDPRARLAKIKK